MSPDPYNLEKVHWTTWHMNHSWSNNHTLGPNWLWWWAGSPHTQQEVHSLRNCWWGVEGTSSGCQWREVSSRSEPMHSNVSPSLSCCRCQRGRRRRGQRRWNSQVVLCLSWPSLASSMASGSLLVAAPAPSSHHVLARQHIPASPSSPLHAHSSSLL